MPTPQHTTQSSDQTSTNSYALVTGSNLYVLGDHDKALNTVSYRIAETGGTNGITARIVGRMRDKDGNNSDWDAASEEAAISASGSTVLEVGPGRLKYDEYGVQIKSTSGGSHGDAEVYGTAKYQPDARGADSDEVRIASRTINAESADVVNVDFALNVRETKRLHVALYDPQAAAGALVPTGAADFTVATGTNGTDIIGGSDDELVFDTTSAGLFELDFTDVNGASSGVILVVVREGDGQGRVLDIFGVAFDGV